jgi:hypothetical protein
MEYRYKVKTATSKIRASIGASEKVEGGAMWVM